MYILLYVIVSHTTKDAILCKELTRPAVSSSSKVCCCTTSKQEVIINRISTRHDVVRNELNSLLIAVITLVYPESIRTEPIAPVEDSVNNILVTIFECHTHLHRSSDCLSAPTSIQAKEVVVVVEELCKGISSECINRGCNFIGVEAVY